MLNMEAGDSFIFFLSNAGRIDASYARCHPIVFCFSHIKIVKGAI